MISADVKADRNKKTGSCIFIRSTFKNWNKMETDVYVSFNFPWYSIQLTIIQEEQWVGKGDILNWFFYTAVIFHGKDKPSWTILNQLIKVSLMRLIVI